MKPLRYVLLSLIFSTSLMGCFTWSTPSAGSRAESLPRPITAFKDPDFASVMFRHVAVLVDTSDLEWRSALEQAIAAKLGERRMSAVQSSRILFPGRDYSRQEERDVLAKYGVDAYLRLTVDTLAVTERHIPLTSTTTTTRDRKQAGNLVGYPPDSLKTERETETVTTTTAGGHTERSVMVRIRMALVDVKTGRTAWLGLNSINGNGMQRKDGFSEEVAGQFVRDSLMVRTVLAAK